MCNRSMKLIDNPGLYYINYLGDGLHIYYDIVY